MSTNEFPENSFIASDGRPLIHKYHNQLQHSQQKPVESAMVMNQQEFSKTNETFASTQKIGHSLLGSVDQKTAAETGGKQSKDNFNDQGEIYLRFLRYKKQNEQSMN